MKEVSNEFQYKDKKYRIVFNLNVMEAIQDEYGTLEKWGELTDGTLGEPDVKALKFGYRAMINEGIEISNEENGTKERLLTLKQVGRIITDFGFNHAARLLHDTVIDSTKSAEKNA